jgi:CHAD domain-containing protein
MSYRFEPGEEVERGIRRIGSEQIDSALREIDDSDLGPHETTHQVRKRCKKLRGLVRLVRLSIGEACYQEENAWFRDTARLLSGGRDRAALRQTYDLLLDTFDVAIDRSAAAPLARRLTESRADWVESGEAERLLAEAKSRLRDGRERLASWQLEHGGFAAIEGGLEKTYRRGRKGFRKAYENPAPERFHEWRKRVKYGWYHMRLLENVWPKSIKARGALQHDLSDILGDHHDLAVMRMWLTAEAEGTVDSATVRALIGIAEEHSRKLEREAHPLGAKLFAEKPSALAKRIAAYWNA